MAAWRYEISLLVLKKYFTCSLRSLVKYFSKKNYVSPRSHVISSINVELNTPYVTYNTSITKFYQCFHISLLVFCFSSK